MKRSPSTNKHHDGSKKTTAAQTEARSTHTVTAAPRHSRSNCSSWAYRKNCKRKHFVNTGSRKCRPRKQVHYHTLRRRCEGAMCARAPANAVHREAAAKMLYTFSTSTAPSQLLVLSRTHRYLNRACFPQCRCVSNHRAQA
jgi:hypothetical protein